MHKAQTILIATLAVGFIILPATVRAEESLIPKDMLYIGQVAVVGGRAVRHASGRFADVDRRSAA